MWPFRVMFLQRKLSRYISQHLANPLTRIQCRDCARYDLAPSDLTRITCGHFWCNECLKKLFWLSIRSIEQMPPYCCSMQPIDFKYAEGLFDHRFSRAWYKTYDKYLSLAAGPLYCPNSNCRTKIDDWRIAFDHTTTKLFAKCAVCGTDVCESCGGRYHTQRACNRRFTETLGIKQIQLWQTCFKCGAESELKAGSNLVHW